jgi:predicted dehydrogenase
MRLALLGSHPDGLAMVSALVDSGRHHLAAHTSALPGDWLHRWGSGARVVFDLEEVLADPTIEAVVVAGSPDNRPTQLRRALQSERHVLCVYPPDRTPEVAYEAAMIQKDTGYALLPLLPEALHPGIARLAELTCGPAKGIALGRGLETTPQRGDMPQGGGSPLGSLRLLEIERAASDEVLINGGEEGLKPSFPGWDVLRRLGGEIAEVSAFAAREELLKGEPVLVAGRFESGALFQETLLPHQPEARWRFTAVGSRGRAELVFPLGGEGPAYLDYRDESGELLEEYWDRWDPWPMLVEAFEAGRGRGSRVEDRETRIDDRGSRIEDSGLRIEDREGHVTTVPAERQSSILHPLSSIFAIRPGWQDAIRGLELDDAARRSVARRRTSPLEYPDASEEVGFKGTMTLVGCGLLWGSMLLLILSRWVPQLGWVIVPLLVLFLGLQFLRYVVPDKRGP